MMARLRPGVTMAQAEAQLAPQFHQWVQSTAKNDKQRSDVPILFLGDGAGGLDTLRRQFSKPLYVLMTLVGLILAIACANVANLQLVRATSRRREIALRLTEGASRMRVIRQLITESVLLSSLGGALGLLFAFWGVRFLTLMLGDGVGAFPAELNWHVAAFTAGLSLLTGVLFGLVPALQSTKLHLVTALKETRWQQPRRRYAGKVTGIWASIASLFGSVSLSQVLVAGQIAISLLILVCAGLFVRTLSNLESVNLGFNRQNLLLFTLNGRQSGHQDGEINEFYADLRERFAAIPGVTSAGLAQSSMIGGEDAMPIGLPGGRPDRRNRYAPVGPKFLTTMQVPILLGRDIDERDKTKSQQVAVINEEFAKNNFPNGSPLGHHVMIWKGSDAREVARDMEIVGVAKNASYGELKAAVPPVVYIPFNQGRPLPNEMMYALRTKGDPLSYVGMVRQILHEADSRVPLSHVHTQQSEIDEQTRQETILAELCTAFAMLALTIACVGLYGTISYTVARRTGEIGIRMALGAQRVPVLWMVLREVLALAAVGLAISIPIALGTSKFVESFLFGMKGNDPLALGLAVMILLLAALLAGGIPARRAARIDPMTALRHE